MGLDMMLYKQKKIRNEEEIAYWRKANMVHKYLCDNGICIKEDVEYIIPVDVLQYTTEPHRWMQYIIHICFQHDITVFLFNLLIT